MANVKLLFCGSVESETDGNTIECFHNAGGELSIIIEEGLGYPKAIIVLDKSTAIKFSKELRKQISEME